MLLQYAWIVPVFVVILGFAIKFSFQMFVRFEPLGPSIEGTLSQADLVAALSSTSLLCVGCTRGIGEAIAMAACRRGARVTVVGRSKPTGWLRRCPTMTHMQADLSSMKNATEVIERLAPHSSGCPYTVDTVLFTVGIVNGLTRQESKEGIELETAVSFLSRFVMTNALITAQQDREKGKLISTETRKPRIFIMGFPGTDHTPQLEDFNWERSWQAWPSHMNTVLANDALVQGVAEKYAHLVNIYGLNPGVLKSDLMFDFLGGKDSWTSRMQQLVIGAVCPSVDDYALTAVQLLASPLLEGMNGASFNQRGEPIKSSKWLLEDSSRVQLVWDRAGELQEKAMSADVGHEPQISAAWAERK